MFIEAAQEQACSKSFTWSITVTTVFPFHRGGSDARPSLVTCAKLLSEGAAQAGPNPRSPAPQPAMHSGPEVMA